MHGFARQACALFDMRTHDIFRQQQQTQNHNWDSLDPRGNCLPRSTGIKQFSKEVTILQIRPDPHGDAPMIRIQGPGCLFLTHMELGLHGHLVALAARRIHRFAPGNRVF